MEQRPHPKSVLTVRKVRVGFPFTPYRAQLALMHGVVKGLQESRHVLLESPTGTGKSMALLCSALAWQRGAIIDYESAMRDYYAEQARGFEGDVHVDAWGGAVKEEGAIKGEVKAEFNGQEKIAKVEVGLAGIAGEAAVSKPEKKEGIAPSKREDTLAKKENNLVNVKPEPEVVDLMDDGEDFVAAKPARDASWQNRRAKPGSSSAAVAVQEPENASLPRDLQNARRGDLPDLVVVDPKRPKPFPRIFYSSRTHSQLTQVVAELKRSGYRPRMTLLASRGEYCLHPVVRHKGATKNDDCMQLVQESACGYFTNQDEVVDAVRSTVGPHDIEDLLTIGKDHRGCPYYSAVELAKEAELILCPYNYLLDVGIRHARDIHLNGDIIIFDEAHNIEDQSREAASFTGRIERFREAAREVEDLTVAGRLGPKNSDIFIAYQTLKELLVAMDNMCDHLIASLKQESNFGGVATEIAKFGGNEMVDKLRAVSIGIEEVKLYRKATQKVWESRDEDYALDTQSTMEGYAVGSQGQGVDGRRRKKSRAGNSEGNRPPWKGLSVCDYVLNILNYAIPNPESYVMALMRKTGGAEVTTELNLWCLNAAVPFHELKTKTRSIVVTSGTLTPLSSFRGELGLDFGTEKSLPHVVDVHKQVFTRVVARGPAPGFVNMDTTYRNTSNFAWQDGLGNCIVDYCKVIPGGVLVFFPSYRLLNNLSLRWQSVGIWEQLETVKGVVVSETSGRGRGSNFDEDMDTYRTHAVTPDGAIMLGVCRGKISEGVDFKDSAARGVLIIGIPFPAAKDPLLLSKRQWNENQRLRAGRKDLMSGGDWYEMQAFRALNQAVGRCIRHRRDYGAIVLLDQRFRSVHTTSQLPTWVRGTIPAGGSSTHEDTVHGLGTFFANVENNLPPET